MGLLGLLMVYYGGLWGILSGLTKSTDHPSTTSGTFSCGFSEPSAHLSGEQEVPRTMWDKPHPRLAESATRKDKTRQDKAGQDKTRQDKAGQDQTRPDDTKTSPGLCK